MANENRLIDANKMREDWLENGQNEYVYDTNAVLDSIDAQPTVDAVEVVRCKDCKHRYTASSGVIFCTQHLTMSANDNDFCSYGERRSDGSNI